MSSNYSNGQIWWGGGASERWPNSILRSFFCCFEFTIASGALMLKCTGPMWKAIGMTVLPGRIFASAAEICDLDWLLYWHRLGLFWSNLLTCTPVCRLPWFMDSKKPSLICHLSLRCAGKVFYLHPTHTHTHTDPVFCWVTRGRKKKGVSCSQTSVCCPVCLLDLTCHLHQNLFPSGKNIPHYFLDLKVRHSRNLASMYQVRFGCSSKPGKWISK